MFEGAYLGEEKVFIFIGGCRAIVDAVHQDIVRLSYLIAHYGPASDQQKVSALPIPVQIPPAIDVGAKKRVEIEIPHPYTGIDA